MARAKRTNDRADARRRHRQAALTPENGEVEGTEAPPDSAGAAQGGRTTGRPSFTAAFRNAYHPANLREDLTYLPSLLRHWSFWAPLVIMAGSGVAAAVAPEQPIVMFLSQTFVLPPALIVMFITGFFAKRATYLLGGILGVANVIVYGAVLFYLVQTGVPGVTPVQAQGAVVSSLTFSPPAGVLFCALAAWYRRFLALTNPNRGRRPTQKARPRPAR